MKLILADCRDALTEIPEGSVDAVVCDPPYELGFMGKRWDASGIAYQVEMWMDVLWVLKPGGHLLAFGGTRTYHRMACAIEDAGFEIRDSIHWIYGSGFPKSLDISKAIDKEAGAEREVVGTDKNFGRTKVADGKTTFGDYEGQWNITTPSTPNAKKWDGWGTALKPAHEPIVVARKPLTGTVAKNVIKHGTGGLNINGCRVEGMPPQVTQGVNSGGSGYKIAKTKQESNPNPAGRWPPNVLFSHGPECEKVCKEGCPIKELDRQSGESATPATYTRGVRAEGEWLHAKEAGTEQAGFGDFGGASRFFPCFRYEAKAGRTERDQGCERILLWENVDLGRETEFLYQHARDISDDIMRRLDDLEWSTTLFGKKRMGQSQKDTVSTIKTALRLTTDLRTLSLSQISGTRDTILDAIRTMPGNGSSLAASAESINQSRQNTTNERMEYLLGVVLAVLETLLRTRESARSGNLHSTVKPIDLMRWLVRLVCPKDGTILDPFMGSGTTGIAAHIEGCKFIGIEKDPEYFKIAEARINEATKQGRLF